ncbi:MAG: hypothetical protein E6J65_05895 [Deltaproteobacteria bacterium]|nr:MAG: hypothetical protein E6J65_05895 [Deltaproteobacteria bacterium]
MIAVLLLALAAPPPLRLADLLREAREKNPDLKAATARMRAAQSGVAPAGALDDPMLMVQLWNTPADFSTVPVMVQLSQNLPLGGKRGARTDLARADAAMAGADHAQKQREVETQVASAYFDLFLADRTQQIDDELEAILRVVLRSSEARVSTGKAEQVELLRAQGALIQVRSERETAIDHRRSAWARLAALLDRDPASSPGTTTQPGVLAQLPDAVALTERATRERPELAGSLAAARLPRQQERAAHRRRAGPARGGAGSRACAAQPRRLRGGGEPRAPARRDAPDRLAPPAHPHRPAGRRERAVQLRGGQDGFHGGARGRTRLAHARDEPGDAPRQL